MKEIRSFAPNFLVMNRITIVTLLISASIHASLIGVFNSGKWMERLVPVMPVKEKDELSLEFIDVPESVPESKAKKESKVISDKTVEAKDRIKENAKDKMARTKEIYKGKQIAKATPEPIVHSPQMQQSVPGQKAQAINQQMQIPSPQVPIPIPQPPAVEYDVINIPEISESIFNAPEEGPLSFEAQSHKIGPYFKQVKKRIGKYWLSYLVFKYQNNAPQESETAISFKILLSGEIVDVKVLEYSGDELFRDFCVASITNTAPYPPLPESLRDEFKKEGGLKIVFTFRYR